MELVQIGQRPGLSEAPKAPLHAKTLKITMVTPPLSHEEMLNYDPGMIMVNPPLGMAYIAGYVREKGYRVELIDAFAEFITEEQTIQRILDSKCDILAVTSVTVSHPRMEKICQTIKEKMSIPIVIGGPHFSAMPERTLQSNAFDFGVSGEAEETFCDLLQFVEGKKIPEEIQGLAYKKNGQVMRNPPRPLIKDIDAIPFPARDLLPALTAYRPSTKYKRWPVTTMMSSRGCPFKCIFCDKSSFGDTFRGRSAKNVVDEMEMLNKGHGIREINFYDDNFLFDMKRVEAICDEILSRGLDMTWSCEGRVHSITLDLAKKMKRAGCWQISFGIESGSQRVLNFIKKGITLQQVRDAVTICNKAGIEAKGYFQIGLPTDNEESIQDTIVFAKSLPLSTASFNITVPYPGAPLYQYAAQYGDFDEGAFEGYMVATDKPVFVTKGLTAEYLVGKQKQAYKEFYMRPRYILHRITKIRSVWDLQRNMKGFLQYFKSFVSRASGS